MLGELVKTRLKVKRVRADTLGYMQRSFLGVVSDVDADEAREVGEKAAQFAIWHDIDGSITIQRTGNYSVDYRIVPLQEIAAKTKTMPAEHLSAAGNDTTVDFYNYARPLLGSGFPTTHRIRALAVGKILKRGEQSRG
jgi:6-phosphofructokinase 1